MIVIVVSNRDALSCSHVTAAFTSWLNVSKNMMNVTLFHPEGFLVLFKEEGLRERALDLRSGTKIHGEAVRFMSWTRLSQATLAMLHFKVRLCIEGVPPHGHQLETVGTLLPREALLENIDFRAKNASEAACCCI